MRGLTDELFKEGRTPSLAFRDVRSPAEYLTTLFGYLSAGGTLMGKHSEEIPVAANHESIHIIRITQ